MSEYFNGKLHGVNDCIAVCSKNPELKGKNLEKLFKRMAEQIDFLDGASVEDNYL